MEEKRVIVPCGHIYLDGRLAIRGPLGAVVCHPHPSYGGTMDNNVVMACLEALWDLGVSTLRFNFRTVGSASTEGNDEVEDVRAAVSFLQAEIQCTMGEIILAGYSFGAWVGLRALLGHAPPFGWVAIAPPVGMWDFSFMKLLGSRKLLIFGTRDEFCPMAEVQHIFSGLTPPKELIPVQGADHFFWGREGQLMAILLSSLTKWLEPRG